MGASESVHNDTDETVEVWYQLLGGGPPAGGYNTLELASGESTPSKFFALSLVHQVCIKYKMKDGFIADKTYAEERTVCATEFAPGCFGMHNVYQVTDLISQSLAAQEEAARIEDYERAQEIAYAKANEERFGQFETPVLPFYHKGSQYCLYSPDLLGTNDYCVADNLLGFSDSTPTLLALVALMLVLLGFKKLATYLISEEPQQVVLVLKEPADADAEVPMSKVIEDASFILPKQASLPNFIHHNPWENLQHMSFTESFKHVEQLRSYMSPSERLFSLTGADPRIKTNAALVDLCAVFLDRGVAKWKPPDREYGFLYFFACLEGLGKAPWREHARSMAKLVLARRRLSPEASLQSMSETIIRENLIAFGTPAEEWINTTRAMLFDLPGWAGMFQRMETHPGEAPPDANVRLADFCVVQSILSRSAIEFLAGQAGWDRETPIGSFLTEAPRQRLHEGGYWQNPSGMAFKDQNIKQREALEAEYEFTTLRAVGGRAMPRGMQGRPNLQVYTSMDERECSFRRHLEDATDVLGEIETFGVPGLFNFPIRYIGAEADSRHDEILALEGTKPDNTLVENRAPDVEWNARRRLFARLELLWENVSFSPLGSLLLAALSPFTFAGLFFMSFFPTTKRTLLEQFWTDTIGEPQKDYEIPISPKEAALRLAQTFHNVGVRDRFSPMILLLGHGSRTVNNPFDAAYNDSCCGGREGGPNARLMARCANDQDIRALLKKEHGISIPSDTWFVGGYHDTTSEIVELFDVEDVPASSMHYFEKAMEVLYKARGMNAMERCSKFMLAGNCRTMEQALTHVHTRSTDVAEARPELAHATNASVIIGRRELTKGLFLARRAFLPTYDPFNDDERGTALERVLTPALIVCSGINLEYLFSTFNGGAGTKACMNVVGNCGVMQGVSGDLLVGLPTQLTEMHSPVRALYLVDAPVSRVKAVLARNETIRNIVVNDWVRMFVRDPHTNIIHKQSQGHYVPIDFLATFGETRGVADSKSFVPFTHQANYGTAVTGHETLSTILAALVMLFSCGGTVHLFGSQSMHGRGPEIAVAGTSLALCALAFQRRFLHGEFMFDRFCVLSALLVTGFNLVATAPSLANVAMGWNLIGFTSAFLIGSYNDRPTVKQNSTYVFFIYRISDVALLLAAAFNDTMLSAVDPDSVGIHASLVAAGLLVAALSKTSQFPVSNLFARSMEGTSPGSAIGEASLAGHIGIVMLSGTMPLWYGFSWARSLLASVGIITVISSALIMQVRADRRGSIGYAISSTMGLLYIILSMGHTDVALVLAFGNAVMRMVQVLCAINHPLEYRHLTGALEHMTDSKVVPKKLYRLSWRLNRMNSDLVLPQVLHFFPGASKFKKLELSKVHQWSLTFLLVVLVGMPFSPLSQFNDQVLMNLLHTSPCTAVCLMVFFTVSSTCLFWFVMAYVLDERRFHHSEALIEKHMGGEGPQGNFGVSNDPNFRISHGFKPLSAEPLSTSDPLKQPLLKHIWKERKERSPTASTASLASTASSSSKASEPSDGPQMGA